MLAQSLYIDAEVDYRLDKATEEYSHGRRHRVGRRPALSLPRPRRRPLALS